MYINKLVRGTLVKKRLRNAAQTKTLVFKTSGKCYMFTFGSTFLPQPPPYNKSSFHWVRVEHLSVSLINL